MPPLRTTLLSYPTLVQKPLLQILTLCALCALITLPNLASTGLADSEAHRVIPALEMVTTGDYLVPTMFDQPYVRKPQLVPWLFAAALSINDNPNLSPELPTRLISAAAFTLMVLGSFLFARRWFGPHAGFPAAAALALTPLFWSPARSAEIESVHNLLTALGAWIAIDLIINASKPFKHKLPAALFLTLAALLMLLAKGPAGFPILLALIISAAILSRSIKSFLNLSILIPIAAAAILFAWHWSNTLQAAGPDAIVQSPNAFMFETGKLLKLAGFIPVSLLTALPITLALLFPWGKDAKTEATESTTHTQQLHTAQLIALAVPLALLIMMLTGVSNDRYAQPILAPLAPLVGWLLITNLQPHRTKILRTLTLGSPKIIAAILCVLAVVHITIIEPTKRESSGQLPAQILATDLQSTLPPTPQSTHYTLVADAMIEARPETLLYLRTALENSGYQLTILWIPKLSPERLANLAVDGHPPLLALLRTDQNGNESDKVLVAQTIATGKVHEFTFALVTLD